MKTTLIVFLIIVSSIAVGIAFFQKGQTAEISVLSDITDSLSAKPDTSAILTYYDLENQKWNGAVFRFSTISDVSLNKYKIRDLETAIELLSSELDRDKAIRKFKSDITSVLDQNDQNLAGKDHSSVYRPIATELIRLKESQAQTKILMIYSDLMENESAFSMYEKKNFQLAEKNPKAVIELFQRQVLLPDLNGISVYFIYQPTTPIQDHQFIVISQLYATMLREKGATVFIRANL